MIQSLPQLSIELTLRAADYFYSGALIQVVDAQLIHRFRTLRLRALIEHCYHHRRRSHSL
jgi:hypothetical protein